MDSITELFEMSNKLDEQVRKCAKKSVEFAEAEKNYKISLAQTALSMKAKDYPVTLIQMIAKGVEAVANARLKRDIAESEYWTANKEYDSLKLKIMLMDRQVAREWSNER